MKLWEVAGMLLAFTNMAIVYVVMDRRQPIFRKLVILMWAGVALTYPFHLGFVAPVFQIIGILALVLSFKMKRKWKASARNKAET